MEKDFLSVNPDAGSNGETVVMVTAAENEDVARQSEIVIAGGGVAKTILVNQSKQLAECGVEVLYSGSGNKIYFEARTIGDLAVSSEIKINFTIEQTNNSGAWAISTPVTVTIPEGDYASPSEEIPYNAYSWRIKDNAATISVKEDKDYFYTFQGFLRQEEINLDGQYDIEQIQCIRGGEQRNVYATFNRQTGTPGIKSTLAFDVLNLPVTASGAAQYSGNASELYVQFVDANGQNPTSAGMYTEDGYMKSVSGTVRKIGTFQHSILDGGFTAQFKIEGESTLYMFTFRYTGQNVRRFPDPIGLNS